jgi:hypothetical protein
MHVVFNITKESRVLIAGIAFIPRYESQATPHVLKCNKPESVTTSRYNFVMNKYQHVLGRIQHLSM